MTSNSVKSPRLDDQQKEPQRYLTLPVVYLNNIFQAHYVSVQILQTHPITPLEVHEPTVEQLQILYKYNFYKVEPARDAVQMPAFLSYNEIMMLAKARQTTDDKTRLLLLYAATYTSPYLLPALNYLLPEHLHFNAFYNFLENPIVKFGGREKIMYLSPIYLRERPEIITKLVTDPFCCAPIPGVTCSLTAYDGHSITEDCCIFAPPRSNRYVVNIAILSDEDDRLYRYIVKESGYMVSKSVYFESKRIEAGKMFVNQAREKYDPMLLQKFHQIMSASNDKQISLDTLQLAVTMLFFDKLDLINYFSIMQKCSSLNETKNKQFGWPTIYPPSDSLQAIATMITRVDEIQQIACKQVRSLILNDIYYNFYLQAKRGYEQQINKYSNIKVIKTDTRQFLENGVKMCEIRVQSQGFLTIKIPWDVYEAGIDADICSSQYKALYSLIAEQIVSKAKARKPKREGKSAAASASNVYAGATNEETDVEPSQLRNLIKSREFVNIQPKLSARVDQAYLVLQLIKAGKLNTLTIFDLDDFYDLCFQVCNSDNVGYPPFYYHELMYKASFGLQPGVIRAGRAVYAVLLRYLFADSELLLKYPEICDEGSDLPALTTNSNLFVAETAQVNKELFQLIIKQEVSLLEVITCAIDHTRQFSLINAKDALHINGESQEKELTLSYPREQMNSSQLSSETGTKRRIEELSELFDQKTQNLRPGFALLANEEVFNDVEDLNSYCYVLGNSKYVPIQVARFYNPRKFSYACRILQAVDLIFNIKPKMIQASLWLNYRLLFGYYLSSRGVDITYFKQKYPSKFQQQYHILERANSSLSLVEAKHIDALRNDYNEYNIYAELFRTCMYDMDYRVCPSYYLGANPLSTLFSPTAVSITYQPLLFYNMQSPEDIKEIQQQEMVEKELFVYPPVLEEIQPDYEPEVDPSVLKKENIIVKLKTVTQNYKIMPEEMFQIHQRQHPEQFDLGIYEQDKFHNPTSFNETRYLANSVLNRGKYFTIPFGSEAQHISNDIILDNDIEDSAYAENKRSRSNQSAIKSYYLTFSQPTGAEARVCHIEEEQLCFGLFQVRTAEILKVFTEWMALFTPRLLRYFSYNITATIAKAPPEVVQHYRYRQHIDQGLSNKMNNYFYSNYYKYYCEDMEEIEQLSEASDEDFINPFSKEFDDDLRNLAKRYYKYADICLSDELLAGTGAIEFKDDWIDRTCYAPVSPWLLENGESIIATPPPPRLSGILQLHLTQIYTSGQIVYELVKNPIIAVPIVARTLYHMLSENELAEYRAATCWRLLYPESYYKSIDHATVTLIYYDKKYTQPKAFQQDMARRIKDSEAGINPNALDSCLDVCLPRIFDYVYFTKYAQIEKIQITYSLALQYEYRLRVYQSFSPPSQFNMFFKFSTVDQLSETLRLCDEINVPLDWQMVGARLTYKLSQSIIQQFESYNGDNFRENALRLCDAAEDLQKIFAYFSQGNISLLLPNDLLQKLIDHYGQQFIVDSRATNVQLMKEERKTSCKSKMAYVEDVVEDLNRMNLCLNESSKQLYSDESAKQVIANLKQLTYDSAEAYMRLRYQFEKLVEQNAYIPSMFDEKREIKDAAYFYTKYRHMSFPCCTLRSVFLIRSVLFAESMEDEFYDKLVKHQLSYQQLRSYFSEKNEQQKKQLFASILEASQPKQFAQQHLPAFQQEMCKKLLFDEVFIPLLIQQDDLSIRYIDQEILSTMRLLFIAATRVEFSLKVLDLPTHLRYAAIYGTRSMHPIPYNFTQALNLGSSFFGHDIKQHFEQQAKCQKSLLDTVCAQCSQKIFYGHYPYINLMNTSDSSVCGCKCYQLKCTFCGGIGAGYNGTLSGSINSKFTTPVEQTHTLCNGIAKAPIHDIFDWDDIVNLKYLQYSEIPDQISLLYKMPTIIPHYKYENSIYQSDEEIKQQRRMRRGSKSESSEDEEDESVFIEKKLAFLKEKIDVKKSEYFVPYFGSRLCDTVFMIPPVPFYLYSSRNQLKEKFYDAWLRISYQDLPIKIQGCSKLNYIITEHLQADPSILAVDDFVLSSFFKEIPDIEAFQFRNIIKTSHLLPRYHEFYYLFTQVQQQKDDELTSECQAVLGIYAYPFLTVKRHLNMVLKRIDTLAYKLIAHHMDIPSFQLFRSSKSTSANCLTVALLLFTMWQQKLRDPMKRCLPWVFGKEIIKYLGDSDDELYICESYQGFLNVQALLVEGNGK